MSRVAIDARELRTSTGRYIERLLYYLQKQPEAKDHEFIVLLKPQDVAGWQPNAPNFTKIACPYKEFTFSEQLGFKRQLKSLRPDLVHFGMTQQPIWYKGKVITTVHDLTTLRFTNPDKNAAVFKLKQKVYAHVTKCAARKSVSIITPTQFVKNDLVDYAGIDPAKVAVTYEAADHIETPAEPISGLEGKDFIAYVGRPTPHKNLERLIEAFGLLRAQHPKVVLALGGKKDANYERIEALAKQKGVDNIVFTGFLSEGQLRWFYEHCSVYAFPSLSEGFGLPGLEAMLHGAPVASSNATCLPEVYGNAAHYFDPTSTQEMADAINELLTNKDLRQRLTAAGREQAAKYSWSKMAAETLELYNQALTQD